MPNAIFDELLRDRLLAHEEKAWHELSDAFLMLLIRDVGHLCSSQIPDVNVRGEIAGAVMESLLESDYRRLRLFDARRSSFTTYLAVLSRDHIIRHLCANHTRLKREMAPKPRKGTPPAADLPSNLIMAEFKKDLPKKMRDFFETLVSGNSVEPRKKKSLTKAEQKMRERLEKRFKMYVRSWNGGGVRES